MTIAAINHIEIVAGRFGDTQIRIAGTPFKVQDIVQMYVLGHASIEWIVENYDLTHAQIHSALAYYYDHQAEIDQMMKDDEIRVQELLKGAISHEEFVAKVKARKSLP